MKDQFLRPAKSQAKWYRLYSNHKDDSTAKSTWNTDASHLNSSYGKIARQARLSSIQPTSHHISQENLHKWEKSAREATVGCNQAASYNRCVFKVQQDMQSQLKTLRSTSKGKGSSKVTTATNKLHYLVDFNASITQAVAKTMEHLTDFVFVSMGNLTLARKDSYLTRVKTGIKLNTFAAVRPAPLQAGTLFPDSVLKCAEDDIAHCESKGQSTIFA